MVDKISVAEVAEKVVFEDDHVLVIVEKEEKDIELVDISKIVNVHSYEKIENLVVYQRKDIILYVLYKDVYHFKN